MKKIYFSFFFCTLSLFLLQAQTPQEELLNKFTGYFSIQKEVAYLHLNKSLFLQGEELGIAAYVVNKKNLKPSGETSNLYVQIRNDNGKIISEEVLLIENGIGSGVVNIDTEFLPGDYTVTAFTNWMRNFDERNYFSEKIKILQSNLDYTRNSRDALRTVDAQFLPESGHLLANILNHIGVIVKDSFGHGLSNATVHVKDGQGEIIRNIELNEFGIGKFSLIPNMNEKYTAVVLHGEKELPVDFNTKVEEVGVVISATQRNSELRVQVSTNSESLPRLKGAPYILVVQGRNLLETFELSFEERENIPLIFNFKDMDPGVNIITLFTSDLQPIAERLVFNHFDLPVEKNLRPRVIQSSDTLEIKFAFAVQKDRALSVSVLPENTVSYNRNHNILSYNFLQPYVRGTIENGGWYFEDVDSRKKYELDNLLMTQGWGSYDWNTIFNNGIELAYEAEKNFGFEAQIVNKQLFRKNQRYVVHATSVNTIDYFEIPKGSEKFIYEGFKAMEGENLIMSRMKKNNDLLPAGLSVRFFPQKVPDFNPPAENLPQKIQKMDESRGVAENVFEDDFMNGFEELGEVMLEYTRDEAKERERELNKSAFYNVSVVTEEDLRRHQSLADYLRTKFLVVREDSGILRVYARNNPMIVFLDDQRLVDAGILYRFPLHNIDYVSIDRSGSSLEGSGRPVLKVYSDLTNRNDITRNRNSIQEFEIPLTYSRKKTFYTPEYENTNDQFFQKFGVIDWKSELVSKDGEDISFFIQKPEVDYQLIVEGITSDGTLIQEVHSFSATELD